MPSKNQLRSKSRFWRNYEGEVQTVVCRYDPLVMGLGSFLLEIQKMIEIVKTMTDDELLMAKFH